MRITEEAKEIITKAITSNNCDCLKVMLKKSCCGISVYLSLGKLKVDESAVQIDGVPVIMDDQASERAESVTLATENGKLIIKDDKASSCCS